MNEVWWNVFTVVAVIVTWFLAYRIGHTKGYIKGQWDERWQSYAPHQHSVRHVTVPPRPIQHIAISGVEVPHIIHAAPADDEGTMKCCGRTPFEVNRFDGLTNDDKQVTCRGRVR